MSARVTVPREILQALMRLRAFGQSNMRDIPATIIFLKEQGDVDTIDWIIANQEQYVKGVSIGFEPEPTRSGVRSKHGPNALAGIGHEQFPVSDKRPTDSAQWS